MVITFEFPDAARAERFFACVIGDDSPEPVEVSRSHRVVDVEGAEPNLSRIRSVAATYGGIESQ